MMAKLQKKTETSTTTKLFSWVFWYWNYSFICQDPKSTLHCPGHLYMLAPSLGQTFPSLDLTVTPLALLEEGEEEEQGVFQEQCTEQKIAVEGPVVIINILKIRDPEELAKYNDPILFKLFPAVNTNILLAGKPRCRMTWWVFTRPAEARKGL